MGIRGIPSRCPAISVWIWLVWLRFSFGVGCKLNRILLQVLCHFGDSVMMKPQLTLRQLSMAFVNDTHDPLKRQYANRNDYRPGSPACHALKLFMLCKCSLRLCLHSFSFFIFRSFLWLWSLSKWEKAHSGGKALPLERACYQLVR